MKITIEEFSREVTIEDADAITWFDGFDLFANALRGVGFQLPFDNDQLRDALDMATADDEGGIDE